MLNRALALLAIPSLLVALVTLPEQASSLTSHRECVPRGTKVVCVIVEDQVATTTIGKANGSKPAPKPTDRERSPLEGDCRYRPMAHQPDAGDPMWEGHDPAAGSLVTRSCFIKVNKAGVVDGLAWRDVGFSFAQNGQPPVDLPPIDPGKLIETEVSKKIGSPNLHVGPVPTRIAVKLPVWLWIDDPGQLTVTAAAGAVVVTATATIVTTTWSMGDSVNPPTDGPISHVPPFNCTGTGSPAPAEKIDRAVQPPCGYTYHWKSTASRTAKACSWPVNVDANWHVQWTATTGAAGEFDMKASAQTQLRVGEWRATLVSDQAAAEAPDAPADPNCRS